MDDQRDRRAGAGPPPAESREAEEAIRRKHGIDRLPEGEELTDEAGFSRMQDEWDRARRTLEAGRRGEEGDRDRAEEEVLLLEIVSQPTYRGPSGAPADRRAGVVPTAPGEVAALEAKLLAAGDRDQIAHLALQLARSHACACALFVVHRGMIMGLRGQGGGLEERTLGVVVPVGSGSLFAEVARLRAPVRFGAPAHHLDERILRALGRCDAAERLLVPVSIRGRVVNLLYADNGPDALGETSAAALRALADCIARAYERLILARKGNTA
jgi:hypothetical protein